ncbi:MAG: ferritin-like domain-containing protein [Fodinibius sp.]|nr:ferritin-like domain-containing protein [Fodinibius sp.]
MKNCIPICKSKSTKWQSGFLPWDTLPATVISSYIKHSEITESNQISDGKTAVREILEAFKITLRLQREILEISDEAGDEGTNALMSDYIREQEKEVWMYSSYAKSN